MYVCMYTILTCDPVINKTDPVIIKSDPARIQCVKLTNAPKGALEVRLNALFRNNDGPTNQLTDQPTNHGPMVIGKFHFR